MDNKPSWKLCLFSSLTFVTPCVLTAIELYDKSPLVITISIAIALLIPFAAYIATLGLLMIILGIIPCNFYSMLALDIIRIIITQSKDNLYLESLDIEISKINQATSMFIKTIAFIGTALSVYMLIKSS